MSTIVSCLSYIVEQHKFPQRVRAKHLNWNTEDRAKQNTIWKYQKFISNFETWNVLKNSQNGELYLVIETFEQIFEEDRHKLGEMQKN